MIGVLWIIVGAVFISGPWSLFWILGGLVFIAIGMLSGIKNQKDQLVILKFMEENNKKYPEGHFVGMWMGIGIAIFTGVGVPVAFATGNPGLLGIGPALGVSIGLAIGSGIENKYKKEGKIRSLTEEERKRKKIGITIGVISLVAFFLVGLLIFLSRI